MSKKPLVIANWKMELSQKAAVEAARRFGKMDESGGKGVEVVLCPSYPALAAVAQVAQAAQGDVGVGVQAIAWEEKGALTGFVSLTQVREFATWCLIGHSEQRSYAGETDEMVVRKTELALLHGFTPVVCIGESQEEREGDEVVERIEAQLKGLIETVQRVAWGKVVIAYEPIWAIGTGVLPEPNEVSEVLLFIRKLVASKHGAQVAEKVRILYGGSVKEENVAEYISGPGADGVLVGGASLAPASLAGIIREVEKAYAAR